MKVLLLSTRPLGATDVDRVLLSGLHPSAVDVAPSVALGLARLDHFTPDLIVVSLPDPQAGEVLRQQLQERGLQIPTVIVATAEAGRVADASPGPVLHEAAAPDAEPAAAGAPELPSADLDLLVRDGDEHATPTELHLEARLTDAALAQARSELDEIERTGGQPAEPIDAETRWLLYEVASIGHVTTTADGSILAANDVAAQLLGHFSPVSLAASGVMPAAVLEAAGAYAQRPSRFELCLQHGEDGPLHWIVGLALPQGGMPATVTWFLIDVSEQRLQTRRSRFLRRMESLTHVLSAATAECSTLVDTGSRALTSARDRLPGDVDVEAAMQALARTQAVLAQLAVFARRRAKRPVLRDLRALIEQIGSVLVHVTGDEIAWSLDLGDAPLYASLDASEFEQCLSGLVSQGREALPLGGQMRLTLEATTREARPEDGRGTRPEVVVTLVLQGYGLQPVTIPPTLQAQALRVGAELEAQQPDHLTTRLVLRLPRVFLTA